MTRLGGGKRFDASKKLIQHLVVMLLFTVNISMIRTQSGICSPPLDLKQVL